MSKSMDRSLYDKASAMNELKPVLTFWQHSSIASLINSLWLLLLKYPPKKKEYFKKLTNTQI